MDDATWSDVRPRGRSNSIITRCPLARRQLVLSDAPVTFVCRSQQRRRRRHFVQLVIRTLTKDTTVGRQTRGRSTLMRNTYRRQSTRTGRSAGPTLGRYLLRLRSLSVRVFSARRHETPRQSRDRKDRWFVFFFLSGRFSLEGLYPRVTGELQTSTRQFYFAIYL